jgi:hypothetical protein
MKGIKKAANKLKQQPYDLVRELFYNQFQTILLRNIKVEREKLEEAKKVELEKTEQLKTEQRIKKAEQDLDTLELLITTYYPTVTIEFSTDTITISKEKLKLVEYFNTHTINELLLSYIYKESIQTIDNILIEIKKVQKVKTIKKPEALINQILSSKERQFEIPFDSVNNAIQQQLYQENIVTPKIETGLILTAGEHKLTTALSRLLHENSNTQKGGDNYYLGNSSKEDIKTIIVNNDTKQKEPTPVLITTLFEVTKAYSGNLKPSGKEIQIVENMLTELSNKKHLIRGTRKIKEYKRQGEKITKQTFEYREPLLTYTPVELYKEVSYRGTTTESYKRKIRITLNPIFRNDIENNWIEEPTEINSMLSEAYGSTKISEAALKFYQYLLRLHKHKTAKHDITVTQLYKVLCPSHYPKRLKYVEDSVNKAIDTGINLGLLKSFETTTSKTTGEKMFVFYVNLDWLK